MSPSPPPAASTAPPPAVAGVAEVVHHTAPTDKPPAGPPTSPTLPDAKPPVPPHPPCTEPHTAPATPPAPRPGRRAAADTVDVAAAERLCALLRANDTSVIQAQGRVLRVKHFLPSSAASPAAITAVLDALSSNERVQALYLQNFERGVGDAQIDRLIDVLKLGRIWAVNLGENGEVSKDAWRRLAAELPHTAVSFLYISEHHVLRTDIKDRLRAAARANRARLPPIDPAVARLVKNMWYNPSAWLLAQYKKAHGGQLPPKKPRPPPRERPPGWRPPRVRIPRHDPGKKTTARSAAARQAAEAREARWKRLRVDAADIAAASRRPKRDPDAGLAPPLPAAAVKRPRTVGRRDGGATAWVATAGELKEGAPPPPPPAFCDDADLATWDTPLGDLL